MNGRNHTKENAIAALGNLSIPVRSVMLQARLHRSAIMLMTGQAASDHGEKTLACRVCGTTSAGPMLCKNSTFFIESSVPEKSVF